MGTIFTHLRSQFVTRSITAETEASIRRPSIELEDRLLEVQVQEDTTSKKITSDQHADLTSDNLEELERQYDNNIFTSGADQNYDGEDSMPIIWLDIYVHDSKENIDLQEKLRTITKSLTVFNDDELCEEHIRQLTMSEQVIFIIAGSIGVSFIPLVYHSTQLNIIYVYSLKEEYYKKRFRQYNKVEVVTNANLLIDKIRDQQIRRRTGERFSFNIYTPIEKLLTESQWESNDRFIWICVFMKIYFRVVRSTKLVPVVYHWDQLMDIIQRELYYRSAYQRLLDMICQNFYKHAATYWYTHREPFHKVLNESLRERNLDLILSLQDFLFHLSKGILSLWQIPDSNRVTSDGNSRSNARWKTVDHIFDECSTRCVYRGQSISSNEFEQLKNSIGQLISVNSFLSTSLKESVANKFISGKNDTSTDLYPVLITIEISQQSAKGQCGYIGNISCFSKEEEVLFAPGTVFQLQNVSSNSPWIIKLKLFDKNNPELEKIIATWEEIIASERNQTMLDWIAMRSRSSDYAERYYKLITAYVPYGDPLCLDGYIGLGKVYQRQNLFTEALNYYTQALEMAKGMNNNSRWLARCYSSLANIRISLDQIDKAEILYRDAMSIYDKQGITSCREIADYHNDMGHIWQKKEHYDTAIESFKLAQELYRKNLDQHCPVVPPPLRCLPASVSSLITSLKDLATVLRLQGRFYDASEHQYEAIKVCQQYLRAEDPELGHLYVEMGKTYQLARRFELALSFYHKAAEIYYYTYPQTSSYNQTIRKCIEDTDKEWIQKEKMGLPHHCYEPPDFDQFLSL